MPLSLGFNEEFAVLDGNHRIAVALRLALKDVPVALYRAAIDPRPAHAVSLSAGDFVALEAVWRERNASLSRDARCGVDIVAGVLWRSLAELPGETGGTVVVIGNFDGVHLGHQHVLAQARAEADARGLKLIAVTFDPHPMAVLRPEHAPTMLTTLSQRAELLAAAGADAVLALPFDKDMASWTPDEFAERILLEGLHAEHVVVGANFRYGNRASGDVASLQAFGADHGFTVEAIALDGGPMVWSSTYIRTCIASGDVEGAAQALGRPYSVRGAVVRGDQRGRELGFPTANVPTAALTAVPVDGIYGGWLTRCDTGETWAAAISVGTNPTFDGVVGRRVESYVIDRTDLELYDVEVEVAFVAHVRDMVAFSSVDELITQMHADVDEIKAILDC